MSNYPTPQVNKPHFSFGYTEYEGGPIKEKQCFAFQSEQDLMEFLFDQYNQLTLRRCLKGGRNRVNYFGLLMHSIILPSGKIFDSHEFCLREDIGKHRFEP